VKPADTAAQLVPKRHDNATKDIFGSVGDFDTPSFVRLVLARPESAPVRDRAALVPAGLSEPAATGRR